MPNADKSGSVRFRAHFFHGIVGRLSAFHVSYHLLCSHVDIQPHVKNPEQHIIDSEEESRQDKD